MEFTGERVVIGDMKKYISTLQEHMARYNFVLKVALNKKVLDAACGTGYGTKLLSEAASQIIGVDVDDETIKYAKKLYPEIDFRVCDLNKTIPKGRFDLCISFETIEHLDNPEDFVRRISKNCSEFVFSIPLNNPSRFHKSVWTRHSVEKLMGKYWRKISWYHQQDFNLYPGTADATFLIGHATNK